MAVEIPGNDLICIYLQTELLQVYSPASSKASTRFFSLERQQQISFELYGCIDGGIVIDDRLKKL